MNTPVLFGHFNSLKGKIIMDYTGQDVAVIRINRATA